MRVNSKGSKTNENNIDKNQIKPNLINNISKTQSKIDISKKQIKNKRAINYFTINNNNNNIQNYNSITSNNKENIFSKKNISNYISINNSLLLSAYESSLLILFDSLKSYMKNDLQFFDELKQNFIKNVQSFYQKSKDKLSKIIPNNKNNSNSYSNLTFHKKNNSHLNINNNKSSRQSLFCLSNNSLNKSITSNQTSINNLLQNKKINRITHKKSLYTLMKDSNKTIMPNKAVKNIIKKDCNLSILKSFIDFNKNNKSKTDKHTFISKKNKDVNIINNNGQNINNHITNINNNNNNDNIYYNKIINKMPDDVEKNDEITNYNNLIACIKNSLDDNLKNMFDFSYQSFLNKESEREG